MENGKDNIIKRIKEDTDSRVSEIVSAAKEQARQIISQANAAVLSDKEKAESRLSAEAAEFSRRTAVSAELESKKYLLGKKQTLLTEVFDDVKKAVLAMPREKYLRFMEKLLASYAEKGEELTVCEKDAAIITEKTASKYGCRMSNHYGNFDGGFVLSGYGYEKNVTLDVVLLQARFACETDVSSILFSEE